METSKRAKANAGHSQGGPGATLPVLRRQRVYREVGSEGPAEKYRAVIDGETQDEPVGRRWGKVAGKADL